MKHTAILNEKHPPCMCRRLYTVGHHENRLALSIDFPKKMQAILAKYFPKIPDREIKAAAKAAYGEYASYMKRIQEKGQEFLRKAEEGER